MDDCRPQLGKEGESGWAELSSFEQKETVETVEGGWAREGVEARDVDE